MFLKKTLNNGNSATILTVSRQKTRLSQTLIKYLLTNEYIKWFE